MLAANADWMPKARRFNSDDCSGFIFYPVDNVAMENNDFSSKICVFSAPTSAQSNFWNGTLTMPTDATKSKKCTAISLSSIFWMEKPRMPSFTVGCDQVLVEKQL
jgi:hypothetical protein